MKKVINILALIFLSVNVFCYSGIMSGQKNIRITKTKYFDIIYPQSSKESAEVLYNSADEIYEELAEKFELKHKFRLPVVVSAAQDDFNAYFSCGPFNHIVMFDTVCPEEHAVQAEVFLMTFRHELTHAITYNLRNDFWYGFDKAFGDVYNPALLTITTAWAEGATVSLESEYGEGRVNDPYATHMVRQAKIENKFPHYPSVQGGLDVYPYTTESYMFGGMFCSWLQEKYGMEKYAQFWYRCVNLKSLTYIGAFKKVYGISIKKAWKEFMASVEIPEEVENPEKSDATETFPYGKKLSYYTAFTSYKKGFAWYDKYSAGVNYFDGNKKRCLYKHPDVLELSFSKDGRFLAETYSSQNKMVPKNRIRIYDLKNKSFYNFKEESLRSGAIVILGDEYFLGAVKTEGQISTLKIYKLTLGKKTISDLELIFEKKFDSSCQIFSLEGSLNGNLFYILKEKMKYSIVCFNVSDKRCSNYSFEDEKFIVRNLDVKTSMTEPEKNTVAFSWAKEKTIPSLGFLDIENEKIRLQKKSLSGGVYNPVQFGDEIYYAANYYDGFKIYKFSVEKAELEECSVNKKIQEPEENGETASEDTEGREKIPSSKKFSSLLYNFKGPRGTFVPVGIDLSYEPKTISSTEGVGLALLGLTYVSSTPWTNPVWYVTGGYDYVNNFEGASVYCTGGSLTPAFNYTCLSHTGFDSEGFKQTYENLLLSSKLYLFGKTYFQAQESGSFIYDRDYSFLCNKFTAGVGNICRSGFGYYDYSGIQLDAALETDYYLEDYKKKYNQSFYNLSFELILKNSLLLPVTLEGMLFPTDSYLAAGRAMVVLFNTEIQGAQDWFPLLYLNRITLSTSYLAKCRQQIDSWAVNDCWKYINEGEKEYNDEFALTCDIFVTPNFGGLTRMTFAVSNSLIFRFFPEEKEKNFQFSTGIKTNFSLF